MKFGVFDHIERLPDVPIDQQYRDRLELVAQAERGGFYGYHVAEHHHSPLLLAPNQAVYLAAIAQHTQHLRFGPLVYVLPIHHPIRLLEEISMVDNLSNGRFQIGIGRGTGGGQEFAMWGGGATRMKSINGSMRFLGFSCKGSGTTSSLSMAATTTFRTCGWS